MPRRLRAAALLLALWALPAPGQAQRAPIGDAMQGVGFDSRKLIQSVAGGGGLW